MELWQERVIQEKKELDEKIEKLQNKLEGADVYLVEKPERRFLAAQMYAMVNYSAVLGARITSWSQTSAT